MKNKSSSFRQKLTAKSFYITSIAAFAVIIASVIISYYSTDRYESESVPTRSSDTSLYTQNAQADKTDVPDERIYSTFALTTEEEIETSYRPVTTEQTKPSQTTEAPIVNDSYIMPTDGGVMVEFSLEKPQFNKTMGDWRLHTGTDLAPGSDGEVCAIGNGRVKKVISDAKWGYIVEIDHGEFTARYCGLDQDGAVRINQTVKTGDVIGSIGEIPIESLDEPHLHLEIIKSSKYIDPISIVKAN